MFYWFSWCNEATQSKLLGYKWLRTFNCILICTNRRGRIMLTKTQNFSPNGWNKSNWTEISWKNVLSFSNAQKRNACKITAISIKYMIHQSQATTQGWTFKRLGILGVEPLGRSWLNYDWVVYTHGAPASMFCPGSLNSSEEEEDARRVWRRLLLLLLTRS